MLRQEETPKTATDLSGLSPTPTKAEQAVAPVPPRPVSRRKQGVYPWGHEHSAMVRRYQRVLLLCGLSFVLSVPTFAVLMMVFQGQLNVAMSISVVMGAGGFLGLAVTACTMGWKLTHIDRGKPFPTGNDIEAVRSC